MSKTITAGSHTPTGISSWLAVSAVAAGTFLLVTTEFLPVGLLTSIASSAGVSEGRAGLLVTMPGMVAAFAAPALAIAAGRFDRRPVLWLLTGLIIASNSIVAMSSDFITLLAARVVLGVGVGGLWTFAIAVARRLVPEERGARATAIVSAGIGFGTVVGLPAGSALGAVLGWHGTFAITAGFGILVLLAQIVLIPPLPSQTATKVRELTALLRVPRGRAGLIGTVVIVLGHFMAYTYLEPFLSEVSRFDHASLAGALSVFAIAGIAGTFSAEAIAKAGIGRATTIVSLVQAVAILVIAVTNGAHGSMLPGLAIWGFAFGAVPVCIQIWIFNAAPDKYEGSAALVVTFFQAGLATGALAGGMIFDISGLVVVFFAGGLTTLLSTLLFHTASRQRGN